MHDNTQQVKTILSLSYPSGTLNFQLSVEKKMLSFLQKSRSLVGLSLLGLKDRSTSAQQPLFKGSSYPKPNVLAI
jgi:hypothetical protein